MEDPLAELKKEFFDDTGVLSQFDWNWSIHNTGHALHMDDLSGKSRVVFTHLASKTLYFMDTMTGEGDGENKEVSPELWPVLYHIAPFEDTRFDREEVTDRYWEDLTLPEKELVETFDGAVLRHEDATRIMDTQFAIMLNYAKEYTRTRYAEEGDTTIIAGSRSLKDWPNLYLLVSKAIRESKFNVGEIVSGNAEGVDQQGEKYAQEHDIPLRTFPADWDEHGNAAGPIRNEEMAEVADCLIAVWDGESSGTKNMIETAKDKGLDVYVKELDEQEKKP